MINVITGPMFSGKTEELIRRLRRAEIAGKKFLVFKSQLDDRFAGISAIGSRNGLTYPCIPVKDPKIIKEKFLQDFFHAYRIPSIVAIDEAQFFDKNIVDVVVFIADFGIEVIACGLDTDYNYKPFGTMPDLLAIAEKVDKLTAVCMKCGNAATRTYRKTNDTELIKVGEKDIYEARCSRCFNV